jgi:hypothetical protein
MSNLVDRLRMQANAFINLNLVAVAWTGSESSQEETAFITDLREAADRIADLELALVELSQTSGAPSKQCRQRQSAGIARAMGCTPRPRAQAVSGLVARLRPEVDGDVNEPLDRLLDEAADRIEALENWQRLHRGDVMSLNTEVEQCRFENEQLSHELVELSRRGPRRQDQRRFKRATDC